MHCSSIANFFWLSSIIATCFLVLVVLKVAILLFSTININALFLLQLLYKYKGIILGPQFLYCNFFFQNFDMVHNKWSSIILYELIVFSPQLTAYHVKVVSQKFCSHIFSLSNLHNIVYLYLSTLPLFSLFLSSKHNLHLKRIHPH